MPDSSAVRVRRHRGHQGGDHEYCHYGRCPEKTEIMDAWLQRCDIIAILDVLPTMGLDAKTYFDKYDRFAGGYVEAMRKRDAEFPDWEDFTEYVVTETDRIIARSHIKFQIPLSMW